MARLMPSTLAQTELTLERERRASIRQRRQIKGRRAEQRMQIAARQHEASIARHGRRKQWEAEQDVREIAGARAEAREFEETTYRRAVTKEERGALRLQRRREETRKRAEFTVKTGLVWKEGEAGKAGTWGAATKEQRLGLGIEAGGMAGASLRAAQKAAQAAQDIARKREERLGAAAKGKANELTQVTRFRQMADPEAKLDFKTALDIATTVPEAQWGDVAFARLTTKAAQDMMLSQVQEDPDMGEYATAYPDEVRRVIMQNAEEGHGVIYDKIRAAKKQREIRDDVTTMQESVDAGMRMEARRRLAVNGVTSPKNYAEEILHNTIVESTEQSDREKELQKQADRAMESAYKAQEQGDDKDTADYRQSAQRINRKRGVMASSRKKLGSYMRQNEEFLLDYLMGNKPGIAQRIEMLEDAAYAARTGGRREEAARLEAEILNSVPGGATGIAALSQLGQQYQGALQKMIETPEAMPQGEGAPTEGQPAAEPVGAQPAAGQPTAAPGAAQGAAQPAPQPQPTPAAQPAPAPQPEARPEEVPPEPGAPLTEDDLPSDPQQRANILATLKGAREDMEIAKKAMVEADTPEERYKARMKVLGIQNALDRYINELRPRGKLEVF